jgi:hypothetical protein
MKNKRFFCLPLATLFIFFACGTQPVSSPRDVEAGWNLDPEVASEASVYERNETLKLFPDAGKSSPELTFSVALLDAEGSLHALLSKTLYDGLSCEAYAEERWNTVKTKYLNAKPEGGVVSESFNWYFKENGAGFVRKDIVVIQRIRDFYEGGAHGLSEKECFVLDSGKSKQVRLDEVIKKESISAVKKQIETALFAKYSKSTNASTTGGSTLTDIGFFENSVNIPEGNFFISENGLGFVWNSYAIAPYSYGTIEIVLPSDSIKEYVTPYGETIFQSIGK